MDGHEFDFPQAERRAAGRPAANGGTLGFTLVEVLVAAAIISLLMVVLVTIVNQTSSVWTYTTSKIEQFRSAREGFESMTRRLSQATLNTYWDYDDPNKPTTYLRQSELRFISGAGIAGSSNSTPPRPTHGIFFFAPLGFIAPVNSTDASAQSYQGLDNLLNTWGYFIEYADDRAVVPAFAASAIRSRFRLMELMQPSQSMNLYPLEAAAGGNKLYMDKTWFLDPINSNTTGTLIRPVHILAENVIALVLLPKLAPEAQTAGNYNAASLAPQYLYDSTGTGMSTLPDPNLNPKNQLPPIVQVTMVAIDEGSALKFTNQDVASLSTELGGLFTDPANLSADLGATAQAPSTSLAGYLQSHRVHYRIFTSEISIKGAKWSTNQKN